MSGGPVVMAEQARAIPFIDGPGGTLRVTSWLRRAAFDGPLSEVLPDHVWSTAVVDGMACVRIVADNGHATYRLLPGDAPDTFAGELVGMTLDHPRP